MAAAGSRERQGCIEGKIDFAPDSSRSLCMGSRTVLHVIWVQISGGNVVLGGELRAWHLKNGPLSVTCVLNHLCTYVLKLDSSNFLCSILDFVLCYSLNDKSGAAAAV